MKNINSLQDNDNTNYSGIEELFNIENSLLKYNLSIVSKFGFYLEDKKSVLEFGAGIGTLANLFCDIYHVRPDCLEIDSYLLSQLKARGFNAFATPEDLPHRYTAIYSSNVLEHIYDDLGALKTMHSLLEENGTLALYVPAFQCLYSNLDKNVGHYRRYTKRDLITKLESLNFKVTKAHYADSIGFVASIWLKFHKKSNGSLLDNSASLIMYDRYIYPVSSWLDRLGFQRILGKNLFIVAKK